MATFLRVSALCVILSAMTLFAGCSKTNDNWLIGEWVFDLETTKANIPADNKAQGVPDSVAKKMGEQLTNQLINQMINAKFDITAAEMTLTFGNGTKNTGAYEITNRPDANTIVIKAKDGEATTFTKSGKYLCMGTTGAVQFKMYFKPAN